MFLGKGELQGALRETDGKCRGGEMLLIKVIWCLIGYGEVWWSGGLCLEKKKKRQLKVGRDMRLPPPLPLQIIQLHPGVSKLA